MFEDANELAEYLTSLTEFLGTIYHKITEFRLIPPSVSNTNIPNHSAAKIQCEDPNYVYIYPSVQIPAFNIRQDTKFSEIIYPLIPSIQEVNSHVILCTSYFNITKWMKRAILSTKSDWHILTSSPESNSFFNSGGLSSRIPYIYRYNLHSFIKESKASNIRAYEFFMDNQTFHAKGNL